MENAIQKIAQDLESLARLNSIEREFLTLAGRASVLVEVGDIKGARSLMAKMERLHEEVQGMRQREVSI